MLEVRSSDDRGRGVFAAQRIRAGTQVIRALPFAAVPGDGFLSSHCSVCLQTVGPERMQCSKCASAVLCSRCSLSEGAAQIHADECSALARLAAAQPDQRPKDTRSLRLLIRSLCARWRSLAQPANEQYIGSDGSWWGDGDIAVDGFEDIDELVAPPEGSDDDGSDDEDGGGRGGGASESGRGGSAGESGLAPAADASTLVPGVDEEEDEDELGGERLAAALVEMGKQARYFIDSKMRTGIEASAHLMGQLCCNSLTIYGSGGRRGGGRRCGGEEAGVSGEEMREVGVALSASVAMLNHDCQPNVDWALDSDGCLVVTTMCDVSAGCELCLSYVDVRLPASTRKRRVRRCFFFECACAACEAGVARWSCALCATLNGAFDDICTGQYCDARRVAFAMPVLPRGGGAVAGGTRRSSKRKRR